MCVAITLPADKGFLPIAGKYFELYRETLRMNAIKCVIVKIIKRHIESNSDNLIFEDFFRNR